jgi:hypothetical protein
LPFLNDLVESIEMDFREKRSARSSSFFASMACVRLWFERGLVCVAFMRSALSLLAAAALARWLAASWFLGLVWSMVMAVSVLFAGAEVGFEGNKSSRSERIPPPPAPFLVEGWELNNSLPALDCCARSLRSR